MIKLWTETMRYQTAPPPFPCFSQPGDALKNGKIGLTFIQFKLFNHLQISTVSTTFLKLVVSFFLTSFYTRSPRPRCFYFVVLELYKKFRLGHVSISYRCWARWGYQLSRRCSFRGRRFLHNIVNMEVF